MNREQDMSYDRLKGRIEARLPGISRLLLIADPPRGDNSQIPVAQYHTLVMDLELDLQDLFRMVEPSAEEAPADDGELQVTGKTVQVELPPAPDKFHNCSTLLEALTRLLNDTNKKALAAAIGISAPTLHSLLAGKPTRAHVLKKLKAYGIPERLLTPVPVRGGNKPAESRKGWHQNKPKEKVFKPSGDTAEIAALPPAPKPSKPSSKDPMDAEPPNKDSLRYKVWADLTSEGQAPLSEKTFIDGAILRDVALGKKVLTKHITYLVEHYGLSSRYVADYLNDVDGKAIGV